MNEPCRLCGSEPEVATYYDFYRFHCPTPGCPHHLGGWKVYSGKGKWYGSIDEARDAWNQRQRCGETPSAPQTAEPGPKPAREGGEPEIGEIAWHREVIDGYSPSDCPYCGCERVVIGEYEPYHDDKWSYCVEHKDSKRAVKRRCFTMYAAFKTPEDAVRSANRRVAQLAYVDVVSKPYGSLGSEPGPAEVENRPQDGAEHKAKKQLRAEAVERLKASEPKGCFSILRDAFGWSRKSSHTDAEWRDALIDLLTDDAPEQPVESGDTRENLEVDMFYAVTRLWNEAYRLGSKNGVGGFKIDEPFYKLLDRQEAITEHNCRMEYEDMRDYLQARVDSLTAERDELREKNSRQRKQLSELQDAIHERNDGVLKRQWQQQIEELNAERDELKAEVEARRKRANDAERVVLSEEWCVSRVRYEDDIAELKSERDYWKSQMRKCLDGTISTYYTNVMEWPLDRSRACEPSLLVVDAYESMKTFYAEAASERDHLREVVKAQADSFAKMERELHDAEVEAMRNRDGVERLAEKCQAQREELARFNAEKRGKRRLPKHVAWPRHDDGKLVKLDGSDAKDIVFTRDSCLVRYHDGTDEFFAMDELRRRWKERK